MRFCLVPSPQLKTTMEPQKTSFQDYCAPKNGGYEGNRVSLRGEYFGGAQRFLNLAQRPYTTPFKGDKTSSQQSLRGKAITRQRLEV